MLGTRRSSPWAKTNIPCGTLRLCELVKKIRRPSKWWFSVLFKATASVFKLFLEVRTATNRRSWIPSSVLAYLALKAIKNDCSYKKCFVFHIKTIIKYFDYWKELWLKNICRSLKLHNDLSQPFKYLFIVVLYHFIDLVNHCIHIITIFYLKITNLAIIK